MSERAEPQDDVSYVLMLPYDTDDPEFVRGAEVGALEAKVQLLGSVTIHEIMRQENAEMVRRIAAAAQRHYVTTPIDETWMEVTIDPTPQNVVALADLSRDGMDQT